METDRYEAGSSHDPFYKFMVWDYYENTAVAYCYSLENAELVATSLNKNTLISWNTTTKTWKIVS